VIDLLLRGGIVCDGTGGPARIADVGTAEAEEGRRAFLEKRPPQFRRPR
jgi:1,4-dihydroxy-2-naphthoyl-CoA synthase